MVQALSGRDIINMMDGNAKIMKYNDLDKYKNLNSVFWDSKYVFLLYPVVSQNNGHWTLLMKRKPKEVDIFDSYGFFPDTIKDNGGMNYHKYLSDLLIRSPKDIKIYYNENKYQAYNTNFCGHYCLLRAYNNNLSSKQFQKLLDKQGDNVDKYVYDMVME